MAPTRRGGLTPTVSVEVSPAYELLLSIVTATDPAGDTYEIGPEWIARMRARAGDELLGRIDAAGQHDVDTYLHLIGLAYDTPAPRDIAAFLARLRDADPAEIKLHLVTYYARETRRCTPADVIRLAVSGDADAKRAFLGSCHPESESWTEYLRAILDVDGEQLRNELVEVLTEWAERVWEPEATIILPILERDAEAKRELLRERSIDEFVETATNGVEWVARPGVDRVVMVPSFVNRPLVSFSEIGEVQLIVFPVADESVAADSDTPPQRLVRLSKALGDEKRLRILRALADGEKSLMELAELFGLAKTTMHHHMIVLRSAGLVSVPVGTKRYRLRHEAVPDVGALLSGYLEGQPPEPPRSRSHRSGQSG
ncbi:MAG: helix-turn-helix domain-containing protein [Chloroflexi bacterium]|nr:helix-turn-helix domain-containing protein [Chloroflexota bacterium]